MHVRRVARWKVIAPAAIILVGALALCLGAHRGNAQIATTDSRSAISASEFDDAYFDCLRVQTRSLVSPGTEVAIASPSFSVVGTILQADGDWLTFVPASPSVPSLNLVAGSTHSSCHGVSVEERYRDREGRLHVRIGSGASLPATRPLPPSQL